MPVEKHTVVTRTLWVSRCPTCDSTAESETRKKERRCEACRTWVPFTEITFSSPEYGGK